jgi:hypothetical protein
LFGEAIEKYSTTTPVESPIANIPIIIDSFFMDRYNSGMLDVTTLSVMVKKQYFSIPIIEDFSDPSSVYVITQPLRSVIYGLLLTHNPQQKVEEYLQTKKDYKKFEVQVASKVCIHHLFILTFVAQR